MLKQMRDGAKSAVIKYTLFGLLTLAMGGFALMGGQGTFRDALKDDTIVSFGREKISAQTFENIVRDNIRDQRMKQSDAYRAHVPQQVLKQQIDTHVLAMAADDTGLRVDDTLAAKQVQDIIAPLVEKSGMTKQQALARAEQAYGTNENGFVAMVKSQTATDQLLKVITAGVTAPQQMVNDALKFRNEYRQGEYLRLTAENAGDIKPPSDAELQAYYNSIANEYALPEYRTLSVIILDKKALGDSVKISDDRLKQYYDDNISDYKTPETRVISQAVAPDEATAKLVYEAAQKDKDLQAASKAAGKKVSYIKAAPFAQKDIAPELSKTAFSGQAGDVMPPVKSPLGWHVLYIEKIIPPATKPFEAVKADIENDLSQDKVSEALYQKANKIDDEIAGGKTVSEVAHENNIPEAVLEKIDAHGMGVDGKKTAGSLPIFDKLVATGFALKKGTASQLIETPDGAFAIVGVKDIFPSEQQTFDKVRANVLARWMTDHELKALGAKAAQIVDRLKQGESFSKIATEFKQPVQSTGLIQRSAEPMQVKLDSNLIGALFSLEKLGQATTVTGDNAVTIIRLADRKIEMPAETAKKDGEDMSAILNRALKQDLLEQFRLSLMAKYDVKVNDKLFSSMYEQKTSSDDNGGGSDTEE